MKKPDFVTCNDCQYFWWYAGKCTVHDEPNSDEFDGVEDDAWWSTMCPETIKWCEVFELKHTQEYGSEYYDYLPSNETVEKMRDVYMKMCDEVIEKNNSSNTSKTKEKE